jgi:hypothetical protein
VFQNHMFLGRQSGGGGARVVPDAVVLGVLVEIVALRSAGLSLRAISGALAARGRPPGMGSRSPL